MVSAMLVLLLSCLLSLSSCFVLRPFAPRRNSAIRYTQDNDSETNKETTKRLDSVFKKVRAASEKGNSKMLTEGSKYVVRTEVIIGASLASHLIHASKPHVTLFEIGRIAMTVFSLALLLEFFSGETFLQQFEEGVTTVEKYGMLTSSIICGSLLLVGNLLLEEG